MSINEKDRLDLRQELERIFSNKRFADIAMEAMPPLDYASLATHRDLQSLGQDLRGDMAQLRGEMAELRGEMKSELANHLKITIAAQLTTMVMLGAWVAALG